MHQCFHSFSGTDKRERFLNHLDSFLRNHQNPQQSVYNDEIDFALSGQISGQSIYELALPDSTVF